MATTARQTTARLTWMAAAAQVALDQGAKRWVTAMLPYGRAFALWPGRLYLVWRTNWRYVAGAKRWQLSPFVNGAMLGLAALVIALVYILYTRRAGSRTWARLALAGFLGGLASHMLDLAVTGGIVDYVWSPLLGGWAFDLGDLAILGASMATVVESIISPLSPAGVPQNREETTSAPDLP